jgi:hypothetical protein
MPVAARGRFSGELVCYARSVVHQEWPRMEAGNLTEGYNPWGITMFRTLETVEPHSSSEQAAYGKWLDQRTDRESARADRIHGAEGVIPTPLWIVLFLTAGIIFIFMLFFADSGEGAITQAMLMGSVMAVVTVTLLVIRGLDNPYQDAPGQLQPTAMERTLVLLDEERRIVGDATALPCADDGQTSG